MLTIKSQEKREEVTTPVSSRLGVVTLEPTPELSVGIPARPVEVEYALYGDLNLPVTVVLGGISASCQVMKSGQDNAHSRATYTQGWWQPLVGPGKAVDCTRTCVLSFNYVAQHRVKTSVSEVRELSLTPADQAKLLNVLLKTLKLNGRITFVGSSYGGMVGLSFAELYPEAIKQLICISASDRSTHTARAIRAIQKGIFELADLPEQKHQALSLARQLAILFYRTDDVFDAQFIDPLLELPQGKVVGYEQTVYSYLAHQGQKFANSNTIETYAALLDSIDTHAVNASKIECDCSFIAVPSDRLVSYESMRKLAHKVNGQSQFYRLESIYGHDAFLKEFQKLTELLKKILGEYDEPATSYASC
ncbi:alpha/beta fold hydrolase [Kangiella shandongensis]|uniref:alpha/beta fold hydrolase n=1 Tax=Kangiella shandongensis TaxID=2763258 RepID=UPI001CC16F84|nr:alpha/beta fold hydrolase [Kangiella shandongensis]